MAEWWQNPAYDARAAAGEVVTPGLVDWGGLINAFNAPYDERTGRLPDGPMPPRSGNTVTSYYNAGSGGPVAPKGDRYGLSADPLEVMSRAGYVPTPRFGTMPPKVAVSPMVTLQNPYPGPTPVPKSQDRLAPMPVGLPLNVPAGPDYKGYKATPRFSTSGVPKAGPDYKGYVATPRFGTASSGSDIIDLSTLYLSDRGAQNTADSEGKPVRTKTGVYYPGGKGPVAASGGGAPRAAAAPARSGGLLGSLFGGGNSGGLFGGGGSGRAPVAITVTGGNPAPAAPGPTYTTTPFQEDRFQTTTGAGMPASMNNSRWTTGY